MDTTEVQFVAQELYTKLEIMSENGIAIFKKLENPNNGLLIAALEDFDCLINCL